MNDMQTNSRPRVIQWFRVYCGVMVVLYVFCIVGGILLLKVSPETLEMTTLEARLTGSLFLGLGVVLAVICTIPFMVKPKPWVWVYGMVIICLGMTSACFLPVCIPLIIFWVKEDTKAYFNYGMR